MTGGLALSLLIWVTAAILPVRTLPDASGFLAGDIARLELTGARNRPALDDDVVAGCLICHLDALSLAEAEVEALAKKIAAISRNEVDHIVPIEALSEDDLMALAKALAEPEAE